MQIELNDIESAFKANSKMGSHRRDDSFAMLYLKNAFGLTEAQLESQISHGPNSMGVDAWHFDETKRNLYLFQFKWNEDHSSFRDSLHDLSHKGIESIFGDGHPSEQFLLKLKSVINENRSIIDQVMLHFVFNGDAVEAGSSPVISNLIEELEGKKYIIDEFFSGRPVRLILEFRSNQNSEVGGVVRNVKTHKYQIDFNRSIASETPAGEEMQIGFIKLADLLRMHREMGPRFFDKNIRSGLSSEKSTNKSLQKTLQQIIIQEKISPEAFLFWHNGVTIAAEQLEIRQGAAYITEPRLLNGAQTVTSLARFVAANEKNEDFQANLHLLDRIRVIGKVVSSADDDFVSSVTICNNRQNPVEPWNLRANDQIQLELQEKLRHDLKIFYERQEGAFSNLSDDDFDELGVSDAKAIELKRLAQTILAAQGEVDKISRMRDVFEGENLYRSTFKERYLKSDARKILIAYKIQFRLSAVIRDIVEKYPTKYHYMGRARHLIWALLVQAIFNDERSERLLETYGTTLTIEQDFTEVLKDYASKRLRFIISDLVEPERYVEMIEGGKFGFLKTKATYQRCMEIAKERFGWTKAGL
jgi:hypothetical protein